MTSADKLDAAADMIQQRGLRKRHYGKPYGGPVCILGALGFVGAGSDWRFIIRHLERTAGVDGIAVWNDHPHRSREQVTALLREAAVRLRLTNPQRRPVMAPVRRNAGGRVVARPRRTESNRIS